MRGEKDDVSAPLRAQLAAREPLLVCDLTQSYSPRGGGGISTYLREKRDYVLAQTPHRLLQIVPGPETKVVEDGRHIWVEIEAPQVRGSPNYRFILKTKPVHAILQHYRPDIVESLCPWLLPWTAINHRKAYPETTLVAGYRTDFPNAHVYRVGAEKFGVPIARALRSISYGYARTTYREFDWVYTLGEDARAKLASLGIAHSSVLSLGVDTALFTPAARDPGYRAELVLGGDGPLLIYAGRIDNEKRADRLLSMFRKLPPELGAAMVMVGDGKLRDRMIAEARGLPIAFPGFEKDRPALARALASSDIYVSAMADETFGISIIEAQASGLPVVGVAAGAMLDRVTDAMGRLGPVGDAEAMTRNILAVWGCDHDSMRESARQHALQFSWDSSMETLFGEIYPAAFARQRERQSKLAGRPALAA